MSLRFDEAIDSRTNNDIPAHDPWSSVRQETYHQPIIQLAAIDHTGCTESGFGAGPCGMDDYSPPPPPRNHKAKRPDPGNPVRVHWCQGGFLEAEDSESVT